jgi:hypothetical protein
VVDPPELDALGPRKRSGRRQDGAAQLGRVQRLHRHRQGDAVAQGARGRGGRTPLQSVQTAKLSPGVGKSWLACALGHKACKEDFSVLYQRVPRLFAALALARRRTLCQVAAHPREKAARTASTGNDAVVRRLASSDAVKIGACAADLDGASACDRTRVSPIRFVQHGSVFKVPYQFALVKSGSGEERLPIFTGLLRGACAQESTLGTAWAHFERSRVLRGARFQGGAQPLQTVGPVTRPYPRHVGQPLALHGRLRRRPPAVFEQRFDKQRLSAFW